MSCYNFSVGLADILDGNSFTGYSIHRSRPKYYCHYGDKNNQYQLSSNIHNCSDTFSLGLLLSIFLNN